MTRDETKGLLQKISINYWQFFKTMPKEYMPTLLAEWYEHLGKYDVEIVAQAVFNHIEVGEYPPKISDMVTQIKEVQKQHYRIKQQTAFQIEHKVEPISETDREKYIKEMKEKLL